MIKKLRLKFIVLSMLAVLVLLAVVVAAMNIINYNSVVKEADEVLQVLSQNEGSFPQFGRKDRKINSAQKATSESRSVTDSSNSSMDEEAILDYYFDDEAEDLDDWMEEQDSYNGRPERPGEFSDDDIWGKLSPETPYESRFFSVVLDEDGNVVQTETSRIKAVDSDTAVAHATTVFQSAKKKGFVESYRFISCTESTGTRITFLDCGRKVQAFHTFMLISILMGFAGYVAFFIVILIFSKKIIHPVAESYEKQKRFITDAGHEIKTPLTIIKADADILEMDLGEGNEWLEDIQKQTERLAGLTNDLIYLARTEEATDTTQMIEFPLSDLAEEVASSFQGPAKAQNKIFTTHIQPMLSLKGDEKKIGQLIGIFLDNALKYSPENGDISLSLEKQGKNIVLMVYNTTAEPVSKENLNLLFDRFYRMDSSRNSKTGGYGIGLSMAKAIVEAHGGKIQAKTGDGQSLKMVVTL